MTSHDELAECRGDPPGRPENHGRPGAPPLRRITGWLALIAVGLWVTPTPAHANNLAVTNVSLTGQDTGNDTYDIAFDISWDNSWRDADISGGTGNYDAVWLFAKYAVYSGGTWSDWEHCKLLNSGSVAAAGSSITFADTGGTYVGAFIHRAASGTGSVDWDTNEIRWDYGTDGVGDTDRVKVKLFGVEMVYVPQGAFYVGDTDGDRSNAFREGGDITPLQITSEGAITVSDTAGNLYYDADTASSGDQSGPVPAAFPKGYDAFFLMKYEISQKQYTDFLNTLTTAQQGNRADGSLNFNSSRNYIKKTSASPAFFGMDADGDAGSATAANRLNLNESTDGEWVGCNFLSWGDVAAWADWAGLRPLTELEFEKSARGPNYPDDDEYAWGNSTVESNTSALSNAAKSDEVPNQGNLNYTSVFPDGPYRVGSFADGSSTRTNAGAGYYGAMEMSGSLWERVVTLGDSDGRSFTGSHGDGVLTTTASYEGNATNTDWPGIDATPARGVTGADGSGFRGGAWNTAAARCVLADRDTAADTQTGRAAGYGGRLARTAP